MSEEARIDLPEGLVIPKYRTVKEVGALKITDIRIVDRDQPDGDVDIAVEGHIPRIRTNMAWCARYQPNVGGYLVFYKDGYLSYSPHQPFDESATRLDDNFEFTPRKKTR